jgi:NADH-dependent peroxiredoxin subunit F
MYELIIIGGGPAGMTAAVYAARKKIKTLLLAREMGGQVVWTSNIENYMGYQMVEGLELMEKFEQQLKQFPIDRLEGEEVSGISRQAEGFEVVSGSGQKFQGLSLIIATGKTPRRLGVPGEERLIGRGVSYCAVCDGPVFSGLNVAVIGGGNSALEAIIDLLKIAEKVYSISEMGFTGDAVLVDRVKNNPKLVTLPQQVVREIGGQEKVEFVIIQDLKSGAKREIQVQGIMVEIGLVPNSGLVKNLVDLNSSGEVVVDCRAATSLPGLLAAGDVTNSPEKQIIIAAGEGAKAALQAQKYLQHLKL